MPPRIASELGNQAFTLDRLAEIATVFKAILDGNYTGSWADLDSFLLEAGLQDAYLVIDQMRLFLDHQEAVYRSTDDKARAADIELCRANLARWVPPSQ